MLAFAALALLPAVCGYVLFEWKVRSDLHALYAGNATPMLVINQPLTYWPEVDDAFGRRFTRSIGDLKVNETFTVAFIADRETAMQARVRTNNLGFLSDKSYEVSRPAGPGEYRIWFAGDSMTGTTTMNFQWVDLVEDLLNSNEDLRRAVGGKVFRTYNGGTPGAGFHYFWEYYQRAGVKLDPDLIVVNYIEADFPRIGKSGHEVHSEDQAQMIRHAADYAGRFRRQPVPVVFTLMPLYQDIYPHPSPYLRTSLLQAAIGGTPIEIMRDHLDWKNRQVEVRSWYNLPHDGHMSDRGGRVYAAAIAGLIGRRIAGNREVRFSATPDVREADKRVSPNLIANPEFRGWVEDKAVRLSGPDMEVAHGWRVGVDGPKGNGLLEARRVPDSTSIAPDHATKSLATAIRLASIRESTAGVPSLYTDISSWRSIAGRPLELSMRLRAAPGYEGAEVMVRFFVRYGAGRRVTQGHELFHDRYRLTGDWVYLSIPLSVPTSDGKTFGEPGSEQLKLQVMAPASGKRFGIEIRDPGLYVVERRTGPSNIVMVGDRNLPVSAFSDLRAQINEKTVGARRFSTRLYGWNRLRGRELPYGFLPTGVPYVAGGVRLRLATEPPEDVFLNVHCVGGELSLKNQDCYHTYQVYAR